MRKHRTNRHIHSVGLGEPQRATAELTVRERNEMMRALGPVVYAVRLPDAVIKIGCTTDLATRVVQLGATEVLAFKPGSFDEEQQIHQSLVPHRHHGHEYYHPAPEVLAVVNDMRDALGLDPIAA